MSRFALRNHLERTRTESFVFVVASTGIAVGTLVAVSWVAGFEHVLARLQAVDPVWFATAFVAQIVAYVGYVFAYREIARVEEGCDLPTRSVVAAVTAGFGPFVARGGFAVDVHAFKAAGLSDREVRTRVLGLGALEYALLAPAACIVAIQLLADGHSPSLGLTLPWAISVPLGFAAALWAVERRDSLRSHDGRRRHLAQMLDSIHVLKCLFVQPRHLLGPLGSAVYWFGDILCLWACLQAFTHGTPDISLLLLGYATGYALTRRTLPLGGAGAVEALLPFALSWCGISLAAAVLAVFAYRVFNLWLPIVPAAIGLRSLKASAAT
ncbi:MAG TPA: lysylphosphatidylglycerol synthase domain-containing protein [Gaiellaceae bacterium]|nr:lysylphosphatidylglycerol synthase domain-containing protein [Gaiellaceae bacterium]